VAEQILASLVKPFVLEGREFFVTASIGIALSPQDGNELSQLMKNADTAMYHAKERGKNNFQFYQADMNASALERLELESDLRHALDQQRIRPLLPAAVQWRRQTPDRRRSVAALEPPTPWPGATGRLYPGTGRAGPGGGRGRLGAGRGVPPTQAPGTRTRCECPRSR
jgi:hypothetical protein